MNEVTLAGNIEFWFDKLHLVYTNGIHLRIDNKAGMVYTAIHKNYWEEEEIKQFREYLGVGTGIGGIGKLASQIPSLGLWNGGVGGAVFWSHISNVESKQLATGLVTTINLSLMPKYTKSMVHFLLRTPNHLSFDEIAQWEKEVYADPQTALPYSDWCEERGWMERAEMLRAN